MEQLSGYDYKADIWSFGITAIEMARGKAPLQDFPPMKVMLLTLNSPPPTLDITDKRYSKQFKDMIDLCLKKSPGRRPTAQQLLRHRFFTRAKSPEYVRDKLLYNMIPLDERVIILKRLREQEEERLLQEQQQKEQQQQQDEGMVEGETRADEDTPVSGRKPPSGWDWGDIKLADQKPRQSVGKEASHADGSTQEQSEENAVPGLAVSVPSRTSSRHASVEGSPQSPRNGADTADFSDTAIRETASRSSITSSTAATPQSVVSPISEPSKTLKRVETRGRFVVETITRKDQSQQQEQAQQQVSDQPLSSSSSSPSDVESTSSTQPQKTVKRKGRFTVEEVEAPQKVIQDQQQVTDIQEQRQRQRQQQPVGIEQQPVRTEDDMLRMQATQTPAAGGQHKVKKRRSGRKFDIKDVNEADLQARKSSSAASSPMHTSAHGASGISSKKPVITSSIERQLKELATQSQQQLKIINALFQMTKDRDSLFSHKYASDNTDCVDLIGRLESRVKHVLDENETLRQENEKLIIELNKYKRRERQQQRERDSISSLTHTASTPTSTPGSTSTSDSEGVSSSLQT